MKNKQKKLRSKSRGLALGGLAGNNAHGAGVLQAALEEARPPDMISCSSGQIHWVHRYLKYWRELNAGPLEHRRGVLRQDLESDIRGVSPTTVEALDAAIVSITGKPGVFRPALPEFPFNVSRNFVGALTRMLTNASIDWQSLFTGYRELARVLPAQALVPLFPDSFFREISDDFNQSHDVGLVFNSYDVHSGEEYVYCNERAAQLLEVKFGERNRYRQRTTYRPISADAVREGLWIYEYGEPRDVSAIDGAYYRQIILSELAPVDTVFVARPINSRWLGSFPDSWIGLQDLKTEVNFNGSYAGERDKIALINRLLDEGKFKSKPKHGKGYHHIDVIELEIESQRGFFEYSHESLAVFDRAYDAARAAFAQQTPGS